jgi:hypothetical protein
VINDDHVMTLLQVTTFLSLLALLGKGSNEVGATLVSKIFQAYFPTFTLPVTAC